MTNSTVNNNSASSGGGILNIEGDATVTLTNSTVSGNSAVFTGGGIYTSGGTVNLRNVTVGFNKADSDANNVGSAGGLYIGDTAVVNARNSIIAENVRGVNILNDCYGTLSSEDYNLVRTTTDCTIAGITTHNKTGMSAILGPLQHNGGVTSTHALLLGSPAIDTGNEIGCKNQSGVTMNPDQRDYYRHVDGNSDGTPRCDMGAFEFNSVAVPTCNTKPAAPALTSPANNTNTNSKKVNLNWNDVSCVTKYKVLVKQDSKNGLTADKKKVVPSEYQTKALTKGHTYFWRVKACNTYGCEKSAWLSLTINP